MVRGTTPTMTVKLKEDSHIDLTQARNVYFTIAQGHNVITKTGEDIDIQEDGLTVLVYLTQEESLSLAEKNAEVQLNWTYENLDGATMRAASKVKLIDVDKQLLRKVIE